jgi:DNA invertase Pin-like site-specific DNA recombinase
MSAFVGMSGAGAASRLARWRLDRLGRSLPHLLAVASDLQDRGVELR